MCSDHHVILVDRCHDCGSRLHFRRPFRRSGALPRREHTGLCHCSVCGLDLRDVKPPSLPYGAFHDAEIVQRVFLETLRLGPQFGSPYDGYELLDFFRETRRALEALAEDFVSAQRRAVPFGGKALALLRSAERALLLAQLPRVMTGAVSIPLRRSRYSSRTVVRLRDEANV